MGYKILTLIFLIMTTLSGVIPIAQNDEMNDLSHEAELEYICSDKYGDFVRFKTDESVEDVLITAAQTTSFYNPISTSADEWITVHFHYYEEGLTTGAVALYIGSEPAAMLYIIDTVECSESIEINPYGYYGTECAGSELIRPDLAGQNFYVDGNQYQINEDGVISWVVPIDMIWRWELYDENQNLIAIVVQTEINNCHVEEQNNE